MKHYLLSILLFIFCLGATQLHSQQINPGSQIDWSHSTGCSTVGSPYIPQSNTCVPFGGVLLNPTGTQTIAQPDAAHPLIVNYLNPQFINGEVQASAFSGADACAKLNAALIYAVSNSYPNVNATGFSGTQGCASNPFALTSVVAAGNTVHLAVRFGVVHFQLGTTASQWHIVNSGISISSPGPYALQLEYTGATNIASALYVDANSTFLAGNGLNGISIDGMYVYGGTSNLTDAILIQGASRGHFSNLSAWGASSCGIHVEGAVTNTFYNPHVSHTDFLFYLGSGSSAGHTTPASGICLDKDFTTGYLVTDSTFVDAIAEGVTGIGWHFIAANSNTFTSGTSEANGQGVVFDTASGANKYNTLISSDLEGNTANITGVDVLDNSGYNFFVSTLAFSTCTGGCAGSIDLTGTGGNDFIIGIGAGGASNTTVGTGAFGYLPFNTEAGGTLPGTAVGYIDMIIAGSKHKIPFY